MATKIQDLSLDERLRLVEDIWDSIAAEQAEVPITPEQQRELDGRLEKYRVDRDRGEPAIEAIERIHARL